MTTTEVKIITLDKLGKYNTLIRKYINDEDAKSFRSVSIDGRTLKYYKEVNPTEDSSPAKEIIIPETDLSAVNSAIENIKGVVDKLDGEDNVEGSVKAQIKAAKTELEGEIEAAKYNDTDIKSRISAVEGSVTTLNGEGVGSVKKQIDDAFNDFASKVSDDGVVNTYKELIDYCATHSAETAEMAGEIQDNTTAISTLENYLGKLPEGAEAKSVIEYINSKVGSVDFSEAIADAKKAGTDAQTSVDALAKRVDIIENTSYVEATEDEINALFA